MSDLNEIYDKRNGKTSSKYKRTSKSKLLKPEGKLSEQAITGKVFSSIGRIIKVETSQKGISKFYECTVAGSLVSQNDDSTIVAVGDSVRILPEISEKTSVKTSATIIKVEPRRNCYARKAAGNVPYEQILAANIDKVFIMMSALDPPYNRRLIDRMLISAELNGIDAVIGINKTDLIDIKEIFHDFDIYKQLGIKVLFFSISENSGIEELVQAIKGFDSVLCGPSGVGKSSLINKILGTEEQSIQEVAERTFKGKHTTSFAKTFTLPFGGTVIDTPGLREFGLWGIEKEELSLYFHDFDSFRSKCKFPLCSHTHEPECGIVEAVESEKLDFQRYESYINIYGTLED
ncbi:MAG: ribosome small subunit-dependent GTPase A [Bacteroidota bacterium]